MSLRKFLVTFPAVVLAVPQYFGPVPVYYNCPIVDTRDNITGTSWFLGTSTPGGARKLSVIFLCHNLRGANLYLNSYHNRRNPHSRQLVQRRRRPRFRRRRHHHCRPRLELRGNLKRRGFHRRRQPAHLSRGKLALRPYCLPWRRESLWSHRAEGRLWFPF
jgi:hypothetical protein